MAKYLDDNGLLYFWQKIKTYISTVLPTKTSDLTNDSGFITSADVPEGATASTTTPKMNGTAAVGSETSFARGDHVHPSDTTRAPLASPALTGTPTAPTATANTDNTQIATTAFVHDVVDALDTGVSDVKVDDESVVTSGIANINTFGSYSSPSKGLVPAPPSRATGGAVKVLTDGVEWQQVGIETSQPTTGPSLGKLLLRSAIGGPSHAVPTASTTNDGAMSSEDKTKLDGITYTGVSDVEVDGTSVVSSGVASIPKASQTQNGVVKVYSPDPSILSITTSSESRVPILDSEDQVSYLCLPDATTTTKGALSASDKTKLDGIATGAEANQFAFSHACIYPDTTVDATSKTDTLTFVAGDNITLDLRDDDDSIRIRASDTKNTAGSTASSSKLFLVGATSQAANPQTYSRSSAYIGTDGHLYSNSLQCVNLSGSQALTNKTYNGYTLAAACAKGVDTSITAGSTSANLPTTAAVETRIANAIAAAQVGASMFQGTVAAQSTITNSAYKKGWYWVVSTAGTYVGQSCEVGDMIFAIADKGSAYSAANFSVVQNNIVTITNGEIDTIVAS